jgi:hypothetical protein
MVIDPLTQPVGSLMRLTEWLDVEDSLAAAAERLRESGAPLLPITSGPYLMGVITEHSLADSLAQGSAPNDSVREALRPAASITSYSSGAQALRTLSETGAPGLIVIDENGRVFGLVTASDLYPRRQFIARPPMVGGMATPFGVYLTTGNVRAGVGDLALVATGMLLFGLFFTSTIVGDYALRSMGGVEAFGAVMPYLRSILPIAMFMILLRSLPLAGIHAAEHKVVHAIERGEELAPEIVRRMPRVHPRCGTNLAVGASLFFGLATWAAIPHEELRLLMAAIVTLAFWRPLGAVVQTFVTTKPPTDRQLAMGISSGQQLLENYTKSRGRRVNFGQRIWNSGLLHVLTGSFLAMMIVDVLARIFRIQIVF